MAVDDQAARPGRYVPKDALALITARRSFRGPFHATPIPDPVIAQILQCGLAAPSSKNAQPWRFHVVSGQSERARFRELVLQAEGVESYVPTDPHTGLSGANWRSTVIESADVLRDAPLAIFIENTGTFSQGRSTLAAAPATQLEASLVTYTLEILGIGASIMNMWTGAMSLGLQGVFMGDIGVAEQAILSGLGADGDLIGVLSLGYPAIEVPEKFPSTALAKDPRVRWHNDAPGDLDRVD